MYWIEIDFANGKTLRKEYESLNDSFAVYRRYCCGSRKRTLVQRVRAGRDDQETFDCNHLENVCM